MALGSIPGAGTNLTTIAQTTILSINLFIVRRDKVTDLKSWSEVKAADIALYTLPEGLVATCELKIEKEIYIGTSDGVYFAYDRRNFGPRNQQETTEAHYVGLQGAVIESLEARREQIVARAADGRIFTAFDFVLKKTR